MPEIDRDVLLDAATLLFLEHNVCFRETDPNRVEPYLVFPELINLKKPPEEETAIKDGAAYTVIGPTENVFASLVVLLGYTNTFTRTSQWQNNARNTERLPVRQSVTGRSKPANSKRRDGRRLLIPSRFVSVPKGNSRDRSPPAH